MLCGADIMKETINRNVFVKKAASSSIIRTIISCLPLGDKRTEHFYIMTKEDYDALYISI